jgi:hypothetical protein
MSKRKSHTQKQRVIDVYCPMYNISESHAIHGIDAQPQVHVDREENNPTVLADDDTHSAPPLDDDGE